MTGFVQLGWRVPSDLWERFEECVYQNRGSHGRYVREAIEQAMREYMDEDDILADAETLLREHTDLRGLSSSTDAAFGTDRFAGEDTKKVSHRVDPALKERFQIFADKHDARSYGRALAYALDTHADGGRARRLLDDVERLVAGGTTTGTTPDGKENESSTDVETGTTDDAKESDLSTDTECGTSSGTTDAQTILEIADEFADCRSFPRIALEKTIAKHAGGDAETIAAYRERVIDQLHLTEHPHKDGMYLTETHREELHLWADMDKPERICLLRRFLVADAIERGKMKHNWSYQDVIDAFEQESGDGPSHQYAYDLMDAAADEAGFAYGTFSRGTSSSGVQLRVNIDEVRGEIIEWCREERGVDPSNVGITLDVTSYTAGSAPEQEASADD